MSLELFAVASVALVFIAVLIILSPGELDLQQVCVQAGAWIDQHLVEFDAPLANLIESEPVI